MVIKGTNGHLVIGNTVIPAHNWRCDAVANLTPNTISAGAQFPRTRTFTLTLTRIRVGPFWMHFPDPGPSRN